MNIIFSDTYVLLKKYQPSCQQEQVCKQKMMELLETCDDCFFRSCRVGHFTASAFLLNQDKTRILLMHHTKLDKWMQLGGHCDGDPNVLAVSIREAQEESGIRNIRALKSDILDLDMHLIPRNANEGSHYHFDIRFLLHAYDDDRFEKNHESKELRWVLKDGSNLPCQSESLTRVCRKLNSL